MKALLLLLFASLVLAGCASTKMTESDRFIWGEESKPSTSPAPAK